jgi:Uma2 family endonuclease
MQQIDSLITVADYERIAALPENRERRLELIDGEIREKTMPTKEHGVIQINLGAALANFAHPRKLGRVATEASYRQRGDVRNARLPDISFSSARTPLVRRGSDEVIPDLVVEIKSPDDSARALRQKIQWFLDNGAKVGLLLIPGKRIVEVYTPDSDDILVAGDVLTLETVLPGFSMAVADIFADPIADLLPPEGDTQAQTQPENGEK